MCNFDVKSAKDALKRLKDGNERFVLANFNDGDISKSKREETFRYGQKPYAVIITCSDSRVIPESIFMTGIGELFVIRVAGNVVGDIELASIEYAVEHLGSPLVVVLGHTHCGAIHCAIECDSIDKANALVKKICKAIGEEKDDKKACRLNVNESLRVVKESLSNLNTVIIGAIYNTESGNVEFYDTER